ncbi:STAS domain-containing protein [Geodermatophilus sp. SYSU D00697]
MAGTVSHVTTGLETTGDEVVLTLDDGVLIHGIADVRRLLDDALTSGARRLVVDLTRVRLLSSPAVTCLLEAHRTCRARGGGVVLRGANRRTEDLLHRSGLSRLIPLERDRRWPTDQTRRLPAATDLPEHSMLTTVIALLVVSLGAAVVGTVVTGLFWLTLVGIAGVLGTGAVGVSRIGVPPEDDAPAVARRSHLRLVGTGRGAAHSGGTADGECRRAA